MKSPCCDKTLIDVECDCDDDDGHDSDCEYCYGDGVIDDYLECTECGEHHHTSDAEVYNNDKEGE